MQIEKYKVPFIEGFNKKIVSEKFNFVENVYKQSQTGSLVTQENIHHYFRLVNFALFMKEIQRLY